MTERNRLTTLALVGCCTLALLVTVGGCSKPDPEAEAAAAAAAAAKAEAEARAAAIAAMPVAPTRDERPWHEHVDELQPTVESWAAAWSAQDVDGYLSHYAPYFSPPNMSRAAWEAQRRDRLTRPKRIRVELDGIERVGTRSGLQSGRQFEYVKVRFRQVYESNTYSDEVTKILELEYLDGGWKIAVETAS